MNWLGRFPELERLPGETRAALDRGAAVLSLPEGARVFGPGQAPANFLLLLEGSVRVQQFSEGGRAIVLYRIGAGESCILTTACLMGYADYPAEAVAETPVKAVAVARPLFDSLLAESAPFRGFVFRNFGQRIAALFRVVEDIAFARMDMRLGQKLLALAGDARELSVTQQGLAEELGTAREVVSRMLAELHRRGWIEAARGRIRITDRAALEAFCRSEP